MKFTKIDRLIFAVLLLKLQIFLFAQKVWLRETVGAAAFRHAARMGVLAFAVDLDDDDVKAAIAAAVEEATAGLKDSQRKLLADLKKAKAGKEVDPAELERLEAEVETLQTQLRDATKQVKDATKRAETAEQTLTAEQGRTQKLVVENGLMAALTEAGVKDPTMLKAAAALIRSGQKIDIGVEGDSHVAKVGDKMLGDFVKAWAGGDEGKAFVAAPGNGGGGAAGSGQGGGKVNPWAKETSNLTEQGRLYKDNPTLAKSLAAEAGVTLP